MTETTIPAQQSDQGGKNKGDRGPSQADVLYFMGKRDYRLLRHEQQLYAVPVEGAPIARPCRAKGGGGATGSLRQLLARDYARESGKVPSQSALADVLNMFEADGMDAAEETVSLRVAPDPDDVNATWLDLGRGDGLSARVDGDGWCVISPDPAVGPLWRRSRLVGELPIPDRPAGHWAPELEKLRELLPVTDKTWPMLVAWLLAALRHDMPRPVAYLTGESGTGKSTSGRMCLRLIDGANAPLRSVPRDEDDLAVTTAAGWVLALDNLSGIPLWLSDALCRVVTGDAQTKRELFTDDDVHLLVFQRPILLTGIDIGALKGDLSERMMPIELAAIPDDQRKTERRLWNAYRDSHPAILGGLLELASLVWAQLPKAGEQLNNRTRMADWCELLWALDTVTGWKTLETYQGVQDAMVDDVIEGDPVASAIYRWAHSDFTPAVWTGKPAALLEMLPPPPIGSEAAKGWPRTATGLGHRLTRAAPVLRKRGVDIRRLERGQAARGQRGYQITIDKTAR